MSSDKRPPRVTRNRLIGLAVCAICVTVVAIFQPELVATIVKAVFGG